MFTLSEDEADVCDLMRVFLRALDHGEEAGVESCFSTDVHARVDAVAHVGREGLAKLLRRAAATGGTGIRTHMIGNPAVDVAGDEAIVGADVRALEVRRDGVGVTVWRLRAYAQRQRGQWLVCGLLLDHVGTEAHAAR